MRLAAVGHYLENNSECRRFQLLRYFDLLSTSTTLDALTCCDVCAKAVTSTCISNE